MLQELALSVFQLCVVYHVTIEPEWIPREENELADYISKLRDYDDWMVHPIIFQQIDKLWGPHTVDRFANTHNAQLERFNSRFWNPGTEAVDTFMADWSGENNWWCPPVALIPRLIQHASRTKAEGTLIISQWPSAPFWPLIFPEGWQPAKFVIEGIRQ